MKVLADLQGHGSRDEAQEALLDGALCIARDAYPGLDCAVQKRRLTELAAPFVSKRHERMPASEQAGLLCHYLGDHYGFCGNVEAYYEPENSYINRVIERRTGIPISLAVVYIMVARSLGIEAGGVGFPGHFLVRIGSGEAWVLVDPFQNRVLSTRDLSQLLARVSGGKLKLEDSMLEVTPTAHVLARMLLNLRHIYARRGDMQHLFVVLDRLVELLPEALEHRRDRGLLGAQLGAPQMARDDLAAYLGALPHASDAAEVRRALDRLPLAGSGDQLS